MQSIGSLYEETFEVVKGSLEASLVAQWERITCNAGDLGLIPALGRLRGGGNDYPLQCSCLENSMDRGAWQATAHGVAKSQT